MRTSRRHSGFTMLELMTVVAIVAVLATLATTALLYGRGRATKNNAVFSVVTLAQAAQTRAAATGNPHYLVVWQGESVNSDYSTPYPFGIYLTERNELGGNAAPDWANIRVADLAALGGTGPEASVGTILERELFAKDRPAEGMRFFPLASVGFTTLPAPFNLVSMSVGSTASAGLPKACSFCVTGTGGARGVLRFDPDGTVRNVTGTARTGVTLAFAESVVPSPPWETSASVRQSDERPAPKVLAIAFPAGQSRVF